MVLNSSYQTRKAMDKIVPVVQEVSFNEEYVLFILRDRRSLDDAEKWINKWLTDRDFSTDWTFVIREERYFKRFVGKSAWSIQMNDPEEMTMLKMIYSS